MKLPEICIERPVLALVLNIYCDDAWDHCVSIFRYTLYA